MSKIRFLIVVTTISFALFTFGIYNLFREIEPNLCQMTYMFQNPQFKAIAVKGGKEFPNYGLYYYNEGYEKGDINNLNGAPVLFLPGNGGSYKQARSLGSVALRMGTGYNKPHLDYFTIDYNEELSAVFGGYLMHQKHYMELCIEAILKLYKKHDATFKRKIVIVGHSMGGVLAKSILDDVGWLEKIVVIIFISSPLDRPVVYADAELDSFYQQTHELLFKTDVNETSLGFTSNATKIVDVVLISIGGGSRDLLVPAELTESKLSDVHAISTSIPNVWLTCDHLSAVWCLQLVKVINKFLYSITFKAAQRFTLFSTNTLLNLQMARRHFVGYNTEPIYRETVEFDFETLPAAKNLNFSIVFAKGIEKLYQQAVILENVATYEHIYIAVTHEVGNQWLFGCEHHNCIQNELLTQQIKQLPSKRGHKSFALLNLAAIFGTFSNWTHLMLRLPVTRKYAALYMDIHNAEERLVNLKAPYWFEIMNKNLITETKPGAMYQQIQIKGLTQTFYAFKLNLMTLNCEQAYEITVKIYAPWANGFDRFYILNDAAADAAKTILINLPKNHELNSNAATQCALYVDLHYDPWCRLSVSYHFSLADTMRNLVQQHLYLLPVHMAVIFIISLGIQLANQQPKKFKNFLQLKSWYIVIAVHLQSNLLSSLSFIPQELQHITKHSFYASLIVHGFAMACCVLISFVIDLNLKMCMKLAAKFMLPQTTSTKMHVTIGILAAIISMACCKGISLALMFFGYFGVIAFAGKSLPQESAQEIVQTATNENKKQEVESEHNTLKTSSANVGLKNLPYHITLMSLVLLLIGVNIGDTVAWIKSLISNAPYPSLHDFTGFIFAPVMFVIYILPLIWHLKAPTSINVAPIYAMILNASAVASLLLCEEKVYLLNYVIPFTFALLVSKELFCKRQI